MNVDPARISDLIQEVAQTVIMPRFRVPESHEAIEKEPGELATIADREAEVALSAAIKSLDPFADIIGEEAVSALPHLMEMVHKADDLWLIDPVDGTNNFIRGSVDFAVMVARLHRGHATHAWVYQPVTDEMTVAEKGSGAWIDRQRLLVPPAPPLDQMIGAAHIKRFPPDMRMRLEAGLKRVRQNRPLFCAGLDYVALCKGLKHFSLYCRTLPWDHVPGTLLYRESGGHSARLDGLNYVSTDLNEGLLSAPDPQSWQRLHEALLGHGEGDFSSRFA